MITRAVIYSGLYILDQLSKISSAVSSALWLKGLVYAAAPRPNAESARNTPRWVIIMVSAVKNWKSSRRSNGGVHWFQFVSEDIFSSLYILRNITGSLQSWVSLTCTKEMLTWNSISWNFSHYLRHGLINNLCYLMTRQVMQTGELTNAMVGAKIPLQYHIT